MACDKRNSYLNTYHMLHILVLHLNCCQAQAIPCRVAKRRHRDTHTLTHHRHRHHVDFSLLSFLLLFTSFHVQIKIDTCSCADAVGGCARCYTMHIQFNFNFPILVQRSCVCVWALIFIFFFPFRINDSSNSLQNEPIQWVNFPSSHVFVNMENAVMRHPYSRKKGNRSWKYENSRQWNHWRVNRWLTTM